MPAIAMTDHGNVFGAYEFYTKAKAAGVKPIIGIEAYFTPNISRFERKGVNFYDGGADDVSARGAYTHMTLLSETTEGMHNLFRLSTGAWRDGLLQAARGSTASCSPSTAKGLIGTTGCPSGEVQVHLRHGQYDAARQVGRRLPGHPRQGQLLPRADGPRARHREPGPRRPAAAGQGPRRSRCWRPTTPTTSSARTRRSQEHLLCINSGSTMDIPAGDGPGQRFAFDGDGYYIKSAEEMRALWVDKYDLREACDNTLLIAERCDVVVHRGQRHLHAALPLPGGGDRGLLAGQGGREGAPVPLPRRHPRRGAQAGRLRGRRHHPDGLPRLLPGRRRLHQLGQGQRHPGRPRPRLRRRLDGRLRDAHHRPRPAGARPDLRALPQPRPRLDARLRHRLRRASARRGDPLRHRQVRRRPGLL